MKVKFGLPQPEIRGFGRIIDRRTGKVQHFWIGSPEALKKEPAKKTEGENSNDPVDRSA